jgi:hypothetical protein
VRQHHCRGVVVQRAGGHFARVDAGLCQGAAKELLHRDHPLAGVHEEYREDLVRPMSQVELQVLLHGLRRVEDRSLFQALGQRAAGEFEHRRELGALGGAAEPLDAPEVIEPGVEQAAEPAEQVEQFLRQLQHVLAGNARVQQQGHEFGVGQRAGAEGDEFFARAQLRAQFLERHGSFGVCAPLPKIRAPDYSGTSPCLRPHALPSSRPAPS